MEQTISFSIFQIILGVVLLLAGQFAISFFSQAGKNLATKSDINDVTRKIEEIRSNLSSKHQVQRIRFETELEALKVLAEKTSLFFLACHDLLLFHESIDLKRPERKKDFIDRLKNLMAESLSKRPFYPESIFKATQSFYWLGVSEALCEEDFENKKESIQKLRTAADDLLQLIRDQVTQWEQKYEI